MRRFITQLFTEPDNKTFCPVRLIAFVGVVEYFVLGIINYVQHATFDPQGFAIGLGALLGGVGVALGLKKDSQANT